MKKISFFFLGLLAMASCQDIQRSEKPEDLIPKDKMVDILVELALLQGAKSTNRSLFEQKGIRPNEYLWDRFDIDSLQFVESNTYYSENYREYEDIYELVQERLEGLRIKYDSLRDREDLKNDSLRTLVSEDTLEVEREREFRDSISTLPTDTDSLLLEEPNVPEGDSIP